MEMENEESILSSKNKQVKASGERDIWEGSLFLFLQFESSFLLSNIELFHWKIT